MDAAVEEGHDVVKSKQERMRTVSLQTITRWGGLRVEMILNESWNVIGNKANLESLGGGNN